MAFMEIWLCLMALTAVVLCSGAVSDDDRFTNAKMNCFMRYLKRHQLMRGDFEEFPSQKDFNATACEGFVASVEDFYYRRIANGSFALRTPGLIQDILQDQGECVEKNLRADKYGDYILKSLIYDALKPLTDDLAVERNETVTNLQGVLAKAISACTFTALYDEYQTLRRNNYCARKYVVANDIMGLGHMNLTLNPFHIDLSAVDCEQIVEGLIADITSDEDSLDRADALRLLSHEWAVIFLTEINVSEEQRRKEQEKYEADLKSIAV